VTGFTKRVFERASKLPPEEVQRLIAALSEEYEIQDAVLESLTTGVIVCGETGRVIHYNKAARLAALPVNFDQDRPIWTVVKHRDLARFLKEVWETQRSYQSGDFIIGLPFLEEKRVTVSTMPLVRNKRFRGNIISVTDTTEKYKDEVLLHRMERQASLTNVAASVAHEIKNPLAGISIHIQLIQKALAAARAGDNKLPEETHLEKYLSIVNEEIERLNAIVADFLTAVRPVKAELTLENPDTLIQKSAEFFQTELEAAHIELRLDLEPEKAPSLLLDEKLFRQALMNLVQNAIHALPQGGIIALNSLVRSDRYILTVADNGVGMDSETQARIFEPYYTTRPEGTGLGLTTVDKIVKEMRGTIDVKSVPKEGTMFILSFPIPQRTKLRLEAPKEVKEMKEWETAQ
jgi:signal transduction histidine kinase